jgi:hypothetical protein
VVEYLDTGLVPRFPTAILASSIGLIAILMLTVGYLLDAIGRSRQEAARLAYLRLPAPQPIPADPYDERTPASRIESQESPQVV